MGQAQGERLGYGSSRGRKEVSLRAERRDVSCRRRSLAEERIEPVGLDVESLKECGLKQQTSQAGRAAGGKRAGE